MTEPTAGRPDRPRPRPAHAAPAASPVPDGGIPVVLPAPPVGGPHRPRRPGKVRRFLRTRRGKWIVAATVAVIAVLAGLLGSGFLSSPAPPLKDAPAVAGGGLDSLAPTPSTGGGTSGAAKSTKPATAQDIRKALQDRVGSVDNPLNSLRSAGEHKVSITVSSTQPLQVVGYLVPTSINTNYAFGTVKPKRPSFALNTTAVGSGYLAAVFVQADKTGAPVTCVVTIDGKATNRETTGGPYGRQVCLG